MNETLNALFRHNEFRTEFHLSIFSLGFVLDKI